MAASDAAAAPFLQARVRDGSQTCWTTLPAAHRAGPGGGDEGAFYAYAYPEPDGFADYPVGPAEAFYCRENGQFLLPYEAVRTADDPDRALMTFLHSTYEAAAERGGWDRAALEDDPARWTICAEPL